MHVLDTADTLIARTSTDAEGMFAVSVPAGSYKVHVAVPGVLPRCPDTTVRVAKQSSASVVIHCDSGIR